MITVVGLDKDGVYLEDIRVTVPYRVAVTIPATQMNSRELGDALNQRRVFQLQGALPQGAIFRGTGAVPRRAAPSPPVPQKVVQPDRELSELLAENVRLKRMLAEQQTLNDGLQTTLIAMSGQLTAIQDVLETLKAQGIQVVTTPSGIVAPAPRKDLDDDVPMFIPSVRRDDVKVAISVKGQESSTDLDASKSALKALRSKKKPDEA